MLLLVSENILQENAVSIVSCRSMTLGKSTCVEGNKECRPKQDTSVSLRTQNPAATPLGRKILKGDSGEELMLFHGLEGYSLTRKCL